MKRHTLRTDDQTTALLGTTIDGFDDVDQFLFVFQDPVQLIVITGSEITHDVLVTEEEHDGTRIIKLCEHSVSHGDRGYSVGTSRQLTIHLVEIRDLVDIADVNDRKTLDLVGDLVEDFVLAHAPSIPISAESDHNQALLFAEDGLVDMPAGVEMRNHDGTHVLL